MTPSLEKLVNSFASLPGIGRKSAARLAYKIIEMSEDEVKAFSDSILQAKASVKLCGVCQSYSENGVCSVCSNDNRNKQMNARTKAVLHIYVFYYALIAPAYLYSYLHQ